MNNLAASYTALGRHAEALKLREETLALRKAKLGPDHPDTLMTMGNLAESLVALDRPSEAVAIIDDCLRRAEGKIVDPRLVPFVLDLRLRAFAKQKDAAGCRQTAELGRSSTATTPTACTTPPASGPSPRACCAPTPGRPTLAGRPTPRPTGP